MAAVAPDAYSSNAQATQADCPLQERLTLRYAGWFFYTEDDGFISFQNHFSISSTCNRESCTSATAIVCLTGSV